MVMPICWAALAANRRVPQIRPAEGNALLAVHGVERPHRGQQHDHGQPAPPGQKRIGSHAGTRALGHEGRAPDKGAEHQHQRMFGLGIHQPIPSTLSRP